MKEKLAVKRIQQWMNEERTALLETADFIFCHPEVSLKEQESSRALAGYLERSGFPSNGARRI